MFLPILCLCTILLLHEAANSALIRSNDGTEIYASAVGKHSNPPIIFVHGLAFSALVFDDLVNDKRLLDRYYIVSYDLRGHGRSGKPNTTESYTSARFSDDFLAVINHFNVNSPIFSGWSYGGTIVNDIFSNLPAHTISGVFAIAAAPSIDLLLPPPQAFELIKLFSVTDDVAVDINAKQAFMDACFNNVSNIPIQTQWSWLGSSVLQLPPVTDLLIQRTQNITKLFVAGEQGIPYLSISGTADKLVENNNVTQALHPYFTNMEVRKIRGGSHALFIDNKDELIEVLIAFSDKIFKKT